MGSKIHDCQHGKDRNDALKRKQQQQCRQVYNRLNDILIDHGCQTLLSPQDAVTFFNVKVQKQIGGSDCGLLALAFATDLCFGLDPHNQKYKQHWMCLNSNMGSQLKGTMEMPQCKPQKEKKGLKNI